MADNYYRLITLQTDIATPVLRDLLEDCVKKDTSTGETFTTLQRYLFLKEPAIGRLFRNEKWKYGQIYPSGKPSSSFVVSDGGTFDVSMLTSLLLGLFKKGKTPVLSSATAIDVRHIKDVRNSKIVAHGFSTNISSQDFENSWNDLEYAILSIAGLKGNAKYLDKVKKEISQTLLSKLPGMWNSCAKWFTSIVEEQADTIRQMQSLIDTGTEIQRHPSGKDQKRFKTVNEKHKALQQNFKTLMANSLHDDIAASTAIAEIRQKLVSSKRVIVTGDGDSQYESVALAAIKELPDYDEEFCVAINDPQEWRDMDEELVKVVVFKDPFGSEEFDRIQCNTILDILERIEKSKTRNMPVTTIILSQKRILDFSFSFVTDHAHAFFGDICEPCKIGSDDCCPIDVEVKKKDALRKKTQPRSHTMKNMLDMSSVYLEGLHTAGVQDTKYAFGELEKYGCLVVTGEKPPDVSSFVAKLATREKGKNTVVLQCPSDIRHVEINVIDILIIDFFAGQFELELGKAKLWMDKFDLLYSLSQKRKLCIILSSTRTVFEALKESLPRNQPVHSLLSRVVDITKNNVLQVIKLEPDARDLDAQAVTSAPTKFGKINNKNVRAMETSTLITNPRVSSATSKLQQGKNTHRLYSNSFPELPSDDLPCILALPEQEELPIISHVASGTRPYPAAALSLAASRKSRGRAKPVPAAPVTNLPVYSATSHRSTVPEEEPPLLAEPCQVHVVSAPAAEQPLLAAPGQAESPKGLGMNGQQPSSVPETEGVTPAQTNLSKIDCEHDISVDVETSTLMTNVSPARPQSMNAPYWYTVRRDGRPIPRCFPVRESPIQIGPDTNIAIALTLLSELLRESK